MNNLAQRTHDPMIERNGISRVEWVYRTLKHFILSNKFYPGYQALEPELATLLGVSRTPVREALIRLENERLIELIPRRGMRVIPLVPDDLREICELLSCLESTAIELLGNKPPDSLAVAYMKEIINELDNQLTSGNREAWATADDKFHQLLVEICGNKRLAKIAAALRDQSHRARPLTLIPRDVASLSTRYHKELIAAICAGDVAKAKVLHHEYRQESATQLVATLRNFPHTRL